MSFLMRWKTSCLLCLALMTVASLVNHGQSRPCGQWFEQTFFINGCQVNPFFIRECARGKPSYQVFFDCFFTSDIRTSQPRTCARDAFKMELCTRRYPENGFSAIMCFVLPQTWNV